MSKRFSKVSPAVWRSKRFNGLSGSDAKLLYLYLVTCEHQSSAGAYEMPDGYAIADLAWELPRYQQARDELIAAELIAFDDDTSTVYVRRWFKHSPPMNEKHAQGIQRIIGELESQIIAEQVQEEFDEATANRNPIDDKPNVSPALMEALNRQSRGFGR